MLKTSLMTEPILTYPDPNLPYVLFTDASKYAWACVLTQEKTHIIEEKEVKILHPITYMSGLFRGSQMNWASLTKEAYAIKNTLADTLSRLIDIDLQVQQESEPEGYEFGYYTFDMLPTLEVSNVETTQNTSENVHDNDAINNDLWELPVNNNALSQLQQKDMFCNNILTQIEKGNINKGQLYTIKDKLLKRYVIDGDNTYETTVMPRALIARILQMVHDNLGHNGTHRMYTLLKRLYYWKGLKRSVAKHIRMCYQCQRRNKQVVKYATLHFDVATFPMQFISMDLIGEFLPPSTKKNRYALTVIRMLMCYIFCIPLRTKTIEEVIQAYIDNIYSKFGGSIKI